MQLAAREDLSNSMGLFLQKTNIIRDYLEDYIDGRAFWPQEVRTRQTRMRCMILEKIRASCPSGWRLSPLRLLKRRGYLVCGG